MITLLMDGRAAQTVAAQAEGEHLWLDAKNLESAAGWALKSQGLCQGDVCVPIPPGHQTEWVRDGQVNLAALWGHLGRPVMHDETGQAWVFGAGSEDRGERLHNLEASDFELPDLSGKLHRLSDHRGKRVFLTTWASW
jgi:hypothetical protein